MDRYKQLLAFVLPYRMRLILGIFCMIAAAMGYLVVPWLIRNVVDGVLQDKDLGYFNYFLASGICYLWAKLYNGLCRTTSSYRHS